MVERFLDVTEYDSYSDFMQNFKVKVPKDFNFGYDVVDAWAAEEPDRTALIWTNPAGDTRTFSFGELKTLTDKFATVLTQNGLGHGSRVMLMLKRRWQFWVAIIALHKVGAVVIPATHLLTGKDIEYRCLKAHVSAIIAAGEPQIVKHITEGVKNCPEVRTLISAGPEVPDGWLDFNAEMEKAAPYRRPEHVNTNDDTMLVYFTSGTSGEPKMVAHDFTYPLGHIITGYIWHNLRGGSRHLTVADTGWGKAVWGKLYGQWIAGAEVMVYDYDKFQPADLLKLIEDFKITSFCAPPTIYRFMIHEDVEAYDLSSLRYCTIAGEALNPSVYDEWLRLTGIKLKAGFGQTETTLTVGNYPWTEPKPGSMGVRGPQYDIDVVDADGNRTADGEEGELVIHVDKAWPVGLFRGYLDDEELTREAIHDGLYHTGDVVTRDADGYHWFVGRIDDVIKSSGYRIGPFEVESALMRHDAVIECAVTGVPDEIRGQVVKAWVVLAPAWRERAGEDLVKELQTFVKNTTAPYKYPRQIEFVDQLPKTISGKIRRVALRQPYVSRNNPEKDLKA